MTRSVRRVFALTGLLCFNWSATAVAFDRCCLHGAAQAAVADAPVPHHGATDSDAPDHAHEHKCACLAGCNVVTVFTGSPTSDAAIKVFAAAFRPAHPMPAVVTPATSRYRLPFANAPPLRIAVPIIRS